MGSISDSAAALETLRQSGAAERDPVRFRYLEALARRSLGQRAAVQDLLATKLSEAVATFIACEDPSPCQPEGIDVVMPPVTSPTTASLSELTRYLAQQSAALTVSERGAVTELKAIRYFRTTWSQLSVEKQLGQAIEQAPENAGPLNSHMLVLRSLTLMRDISPDYLSRFMSYADTLLCLDHAAQQSRPVVTKLAKPAKASKVPKAPKAPKATKTPATPAAPTPR